MVTDDERREVAQKLRELAGGYVTIGELESALGICLSSPEVDLERDAKDLHYLADLIEPSIPADHGEAGLASVNGFIREMRHSTKEEQNEYGAMLKKMSVELHPVDRDALLELADALSGDYRYEGNSIAAKQVVDVFNREHHEFARRIREAIGNGV